MFTPCLLEACLSASSRSCRDSLHVLCGLYFAGRMGMRSFTGLPNTHMVGNIFELGSGVFRYWRIAAWNASMLMVPSFPTLPAINLLTVLTPTSALHLLCGNATELRRWCTPHWCRNFLVVWDTNSGPPSDESLSGIP